MKLSRQQVLLISKTISDYLRQHGKPVPSMEEFDHDVRVGVSAHIEFQMLDATGACRIDLVRDDRENVEVRVQDSRGIVCSKHTDELDDMVMRAILQRDIRANQKALLMNSSIGCPRCGEHKCLVFKDRAWCVSCESDVTLPEEIDELNVHLPIKMIDGQGPAHLPWICSAEAVGDRVGEFGTGYRAAKDFMVQMEYTAAIALYATHYSMTLAGAIEGFREVGFTVTVILVNEREDTAYPTGY